MADLRILPRDWATLRSHLIRRPHYLEQAAFLFAAPHDSDFECRETWMLGPADFDYQSSYHIELADHVRTRVIRHAHATGLVVIEAHSHTGQSPARFSSSDWMGFEEWVPHLRWRLKGRPYGALVFSKNDFDGLLWTTDVPERIGGIRTGMKHHRPTRLSGLALAQEAEDGK